MSTDTKPAVATVALLGNPNTGKSTLFGALVGMHQHVGNYPGVTVEKKTGQMHIDQRCFELIDLPGLYSLAPRSRDEMVSVNVLLGQCPGVAPVDAVVCIVDASNLERNLYLVSQVLEFGLPTIVALNMTDVAHRHGVCIDTQQLQQHLGVPVVKVQANRRVGLDVLKATLATVLDQPSFPCQSPFPEAFEGEVKRLEEVLASEDGNPTSRQRPLPRCLLRRLLVDANGYLFDALFPLAPVYLRTALDEARTRLIAEGHNIPGVETTARYEWVQKTLDGVVVRPEKYVVTYTDKIDRILTHRFWGTSIFALVMVLVFQAIFSWAVPLMGLVDTVFGSLSQWVQANMAEGMLRSLLADGVIAGVGGVVIFLPQILILFIFIALLEDCGYMARAAFLMDRLMARVGLSGKSFIPMISSFACAVPGIMATRVIENERDRLTTILVAPLMTCSARLPVYALLIAAFIPTQTYLGGLVSLQGLTLTALYALGIIAAIVAALVLKKSLLRGAKVPFVLELPSYQWPSLQTVFYRVMQRAWAFLRTAGTVILAVSIAVWAALYFPHDEQAVEGPYRAEREQLVAQLETSSPDEEPYEQASARLAEIDHEIAGTYQRQSILGRLGRVIEPVVEPLGWDWRIGCAVIASFPAREVVVATLGVVYNLGEDVDPESAEDQLQFEARLHAATWDGTDRKVFNTPVALSIMVFFALCAQCAATLAVIRRETNSWRWPLFTFSYMTVLAYVGAFITYQVGMWISGC